MLLVSHSAPKRQRPSPARVLTRANATGTRYQPIVPGSPLNGPTISLVTQPP
jgi:hypothetical protein